MTLRIVQSKQNPRVKEIRAALLHPGRPGSQLIALEGFHLLTEALRSKVKIHTIFIAQGSENMLDSLNLSGTIEILSVPRDILSAALTTETPQPVAALAQAHEWGWPDLWRTTKANSHSEANRALIVVLAGLQDPGNLGAILRCAEAFGASGAICLPGTVSRWNPKAMRGSAGSVFRLPVLAASGDDCFEHLRAAGVRVLAAMAPHTIDARPLDTQDLTGPIAIVIGAEGGGIAPEHAGQSDACITIPCPGPVESLNAAVAAGVLLYEAARQRAARSKNAEPEHAAPAALAEPARRRR